MIFMNIFEVQGKWNIAKGKLKQKFAQLTDDERQFNAGKEDELVGRIQKRAGQAKVEVERVAGESCALNNLRLNECSEGNKP